MAEAQYYSKLVLASASSCVFGVLLILSFFTLSLCWLLARPRHTKLSCLQSLSWTAPTVVALIEWWVVQAKPRLLRSARYHCTFTPYVIISHFAVHYSFAHLFRSKICLFLCSIFLSFHFRIILQSEPTLSIVWSIAAYSNLQWKEPSTIESCVCGQIYIWKPKHSTPFCHMHLSFELNCLSHKPIDPSVWVQANF